MIISAIKSELNFNYNVRKARSPMSHILINERVESPTQNKYKSQKLSNQDASTKPEVKL